MLKALTHSKLSPTPHNTRNSNSVHYYTDYHTEVRNEDERRTIHPQTRQRQHQHSLYQQGINHCFEDS